jgi:hypothetical protein
MEKVDWTKTDDVNLEFFAEGKPNRPKWRDIYANEQLVTVGTRFYIVPVILEAIRRGMEVPEEIAKAVKALDKPTEK